MNWCTRESHFCVSKHSLKRQHKLPVCYLDEACRSEFRRSSVRAAFQQGGVCSFFSQTATEQDQSLLFSWLAMWFFIISFNGLQHKSCGMKRSWYSEASESKAFLDRTHLYLLSKLYLSPLAFCAAVDSMCKSRKDWQSQGKPTRQLIHLEAAQPKQSPVSWSVCVESLGNCAANLPSALGFYE